MTARLPPSSNRTGGFPHPAFRVPFLASIFKLLVSAVCRVRGFGKVGNRATSDISPMRSRAFATTTADSIGGEAIHLPEDSVIVCQSKIIAPAAGHSVDFIDNDLFTLPSARSPRQSTHAAS